MKDKKQLSHKFSHAQHTDQSPRGLQKGRAFTLEKDFRKHPRHPLILRRRHERLASATLFEKPTRGLTAGSLFSVAMISATVLKATRPGAPRWLSRLSARVLISAQVTSPWLVGSKPVSGSVLTTWSLLEILSLSSLSLYPSPACALALSK